MGDLMHALPAVTEAKNKIKDITIDWVVDKNFKSVPEWHPAISKTIETNHREWKLNIFSGNSRKEIRKVISTINNSDYDVVVDMQNNLKSAFLSFLSNKQVAGLDSKSSREFPSHLAYKDKFYIPKTLHAIYRQKKLLAKALGYETDMSLIDYGILKEKFSRPDFALPERSVVCVQNASWKTKQWSIDNWKQLLIDLQGYNLNFLFPSGNSEEYERASEICSISDNALAMEILPLNTIAYILDKADFAICSDTGLAHLSAVTDTRSLTLYGPTKTSLIGTMGENQNHLVGKNSDINNISVKEVISTLTELNFIEENNYL